MISPYVRRLRLATEVRALRAEAALTADQLGKRIGRSRADISRLENGHVVDQADIIAILDAVGVDGERWTQIVTIAREAGERAGGSPTRRWVTARPCTPTWRRAPRASASTSRPSCPGC